MNKRKVKMLYRVSDIAGMILGGIGTAMLCVGEPIGLAFMGVAFVAIIVANRLYGKAHSDRDSKKDKYYSIKQV